VLKSNKQAPLTVIRIIEILNTVFPKDVIHVVPAKGIAVPQALVNHLLIRKISFPGSTNGRVVVGQSALARVTPVLLELGGKYAFIVFVMSWHHPTALLRRLGLKA
jgi:acyl-CoA reductase-like NAD-dependent aldehyde dehydrogenase